MPKYTIEMLMQLRNASAAKKLPVIADLTMPCLKPEFVLNSIFNQRRLAGTCKPMTEQYGFKDQNNEDGPDSASLQMIGGY